MENTSTLKRVYVWEAPVRLTHWVNALCILVLSVTGLYIAHPFVMPAEDSALLMGLVRLTHFAFGFIFLSSLILRFYWLNAGNQWANWKEFVPLTFKRFKEIFACLRYYLFIDREPPRFTGHTALATIAYSGLFLLFTVEMLTGFALYSLERTGFPWNGLEQLVFSCVSEQVVRMIHHAVMWLLATFLVIHIYMSFLIDSAEKSSIISSIVTGYKALPEDEEEGE